MRRSLLAAAGGLLLVVASCAGGLSLLNPGRGIATVPIGNGRAVRIWSEGDWLDYTDVLYEVREGGRIVVPPTFMGTDRGERLDFRSASTADGKLWCVYESTRGTHDPWFVIVYDVETGESWPRSWMDESFNDPAVSRKWRDRYRRLRSENRGLPDNLFEK